MKNNNKEILQITQIKIVLPDKTIELSSEEARKVYEELGNLFKQEKWPEYVPVPYPIWPEPIFIERGPYYPGFDYWKITCDNFTTPIPDIGHSTCLSINLTNNTR